MHPLYQDNEKRGLRPPQSKLVDEGAVTEGDLQQGRV